MKYTRKWMVVPYDKNYISNHQNSHHILKNKILPSDVKTKLFNELLTKLVLKQNPEKQLPVETTKDDENQVSKNLENNYKNIVKDIENKIKEEPNIRNSDDESYSLEELFREPKKESNDEDMMDIDEDTLAVAKKKEIPTRLRAKRLLEQSMNQSIILPKKNRKRTKEFEFNLEDAPSQNTRNQRIQYKMNTAQLGNGWLKYK